MVNQGNQFFISEQHRTYLDTWMNKVSRSFAVVVPAVEEPLRYYLAAAYLICRVIDNIEDCSQPHEWKVKRFSELEVLLDKPQQAMYILEKWEHESWPGLSADEEKIMGISAGSPLWEIFSAFPRSPQAIIRRWTKAMASGMSQLDDPRVSPQFIAVSDTQVIRNKRDYDNYCYIVAGTVGHLATELVSQHYDLPKSTADRLSSRAEACGRGLQKTNIIKDFARDLERGISYLNAGWMQEINNQPLQLGGAPDEWTQKVFDDVLRDLDQATEYLLTLPESALGYRKASLLCLLPAYQTLILASEEKSKLFTPQHNFKISHETMAACMRDTEQLALDNEGIREYSQAARAAIMSSLSGDKPHKKQAASKLQETLASRGA
jgi:farnesyl-diphosphate farnesyltransferase